VKKYYSADLLKNQLAQEAEIAMIALKQYFEDQKLYDYPINNLINKFLPHRNIVLKMFVNRR
jgi:cytidylate kinase